MVNAWGDGFRANEFYGKIQTSVIENGFTKVQEGKSTNEYIFGNQVFSEDVYTSGEKPDSEISQYFPKNLPVLNAENAVSSQTVGGVEIVARYTDADVKANPNKIYVFGDNTQRTGTGGQAQIRNNPNAMGIATKLAPSMEASAFMSDKDLAKNKEVIDGDIAKIKATGKTVILPKDGLGTGLAKLKEKAPQTYEYLKQRLLQEFNFNNDSGTLTQSTADEFALKTKIAELEQKKKTTGLGPVELATLSYLEQQLGKIIKSQC
jgi:hypothetical protein